MSASRAAVLLVVLALCAAAVDAAYCNGKAPRYVSSVKNGHLYMVGSGDDEVPLLHLYGSAYDMGFAFGSLMKDRTVEFMNKVWSYLELQVEQAINGTVTWIPAEALELIADLGLDGALDATYLATKPFTGQYFYDEIRGMADATGVHATRITQVHMIGELTKGSCSMFGAHSSATPDGNLLQLRALDWDTDGPFKDYPQITVYHPSEGVSFINLGWSGWIGGLSGMSAQSMAISEIGVSYPDDTFGKESRIGVPFTFLLRDILQFDRSIDDVIKHITTARRTCNLILGAGDGKHREFRGIQYSHSVANFFTWDNLMPEGDWHPRIQDIVYFGMDWLCPNYDTVLARQLQTFHGKLTPEVAIRNITAIVQTGSLHIAVYDLFRQQMFVANARKDGASGPQYAYDRSFIQLDGPALFAVPPPPSSAFEGLHAVPGAVLRVQHWL